MKCDTHVMSVKLALYTIGVAASAVGPDAKICQEWKKFCQNIAGQHACDQGWEKDFISINQFYDKNEVNEMGYKNLCLIWISKYLLIIRQIFESNWGGADETCFEISRIVHVQILPFWRIFSNWNHC